MCTYLTLITLLYCPLDPQLSPIKPDKNLSHKKLETLSASTSGHAHPHWFFHFFDSPHFISPCIFSISKQKQTKIIKQNKRLLVIIDRHFISIFLSVYVAVFKFYLSKSVPGLLSSRLLIYLQMTCFFFAWNVQILAVNISHTHCETTIFNQEHI